MFVIDYESRNFHFKAYGTTKQKAMNTMKKTLNHHGREYDCRHHWFLKDDQGCKNMDMIEFLEHECNSLEFRGNAGFRDGEKLI